MKEERLELTQEHVRSFRALGRFVELVAGDEQTIKEAVNLGMEEEFALMCLSHESLKFLSTLRPGDVVIRRARKGTP